PIRDREEGNFYRKGWLQVLQSPATIVLIETWSEMHEGTDICESVEYGRLYLDITREFTQLFKQGKTAADTITLKHPRLIPRPAEKEQDGKNYSQAASLSITFGSEGKSNGIFLVSGQSDGPFTPAKIQNEDAVQSPKMDRSYLYFKVADSFFFDQHQPITITYTYWDDGFANHALEYDSHDEHATIDGAYKLTPVIECRQTRRWVTQKVTIADARFVNRQNGRADFRFNIAGGSLAVSRIVITKE
ncbi:MAG TPA: hypothetical protein VJZ27_10845, partial [Aggregatilineales bacterium]|nr:hypothetical protein [Aggregatilineales bacterium]